MNVDGITTRNIKSHLQKYRLRLQKHPSTTSTLSGGGGAFSAARSGGVHSRAISEGATTSADALLSPRAPADAHLLSQTLPHLEEGKHELVLPPPAHCAEQSCTAPHSPTLGGAASASAHPASPALSPHHADSLCMPAALPASESMQSRVLELGPARHPRAAELQLPAPVAPS